MYEQLFQRQEEIFKMLAGQKRLEIVQLLTHGELSVSEMVEMLGIPQANVSQHLALLRQADIVTTRKAGTTIYYGLADKRIAKACSLIRQFLISQNAVTKEAASLLESNLYPLLQDPVCGMRMSPAEIAESTNYQGHDYHFCASGCKHKFEKRPSAYLKRTAAKSN